MLFYLILWCIQCNLFGTLNKLTNINIKLVKMFLFIHKECDQVHIEDVASDDNGQDLRCVLISSAIELSSGSCTASVFSSFLKQIFFQSQVFISTLVTTTFWPMVLMVPLVEEHQEVPLEFRVEWSGHANWPIATAG